jgi:hypothetical protein
MIQISAHAFAPALSGRVFVFQIEQRFQQRNFFFIQINHVSMIRYDSFPEPSRLLIEGIGASPQRIRFRQDLLCRFAKGCDSHRLREIYYLRAFAGQ